MSIAHQRLGRPMGMQSLIHASRMHTTEDNARSPSMMLGVFPINNYLRYLSTPRGNDWLLMTYHSPRRIKIERLIRLFCPLVVFFNEDHVYALRSVCLREPLCVFLFKEKQLLFRFFRVVRLFRVCVYVCVWTGWHIDPCATLCCASNSPRVCLHLSRFC